MDFTSKKENIIVVGFGWVGQANALAFSNSGYPVYFYDVSSPELRYKDKYSDLYNTIPRLLNVLEKESPNTWYMVCVGDRVSEDGVQDISAIRKALVSLEKAKGRIILR